ncbi:ABC transporter ATP-binding protein [Cytobacillus sp. FSL W7-1323]|uniref:ABC transporter ATP-binding protein n=1 Tax=Cytobacillus kochii TaxID=859143 RepID=A0A248TE97_9BACI|nr:MULTISPECIES: ABC transporter ATP-binding protein [Cytobacillus]ASV66486.1 ABC transporter ATP-binding protein [Cytobacillus kochii]MEA1854389.1 ABC transporter ATP-binding protein [Cytobacillus sp. OWB-43]
MTLLKIEDLNKSFKALHILKGVNIEVNKGERHVIIGPNGAGKTTLFNCIYGTLPLSSGKVYLAGKRIDHIPSFKRTEKGMGRTFQKNNLFEELTVEENVRLAIMGKKKYRLNMFKPMQNYNDLAEECHRLLEEWEMTERRTVLVKELSYGEQRLLEIILSLSTNPEIILLDEPTSGMSPTETSRFVKLIKKIPDHITLVIIEHDMEVVFSLANKITVLHHGTAMMTASPEEIRGNQMIQEIYFGGGALSHD